MEQHTQNMIVLILIALDITAMTLYIKLDGLMHPTYNSKQGKKLRSRRI